MEKTANLTPFKPGESGNPGGRPKKKAITDYALQQLDAPIPKSMLAGMKEGPRAVFHEVYGPDPTFGQMVAFKLVQMAARGDMFAIRELLDRAEGKVSQKLTGSDGGPVVFQMFRMGQGPKEEAA